MEHLININHPKQARNWQSIWRVEVPMKVRNFLWHVCRDALPTRARLQFHGVNYLAICLLCGDNIEDVWHLLLGFFCAQ
uniref:Reverse transcriptase zinc-binding domain-containing protein n=1 Tax=Cajanus cajan TaxID=3821 RepID=A0A151SY37_CAJCA|nr:hypothetical protein KK1_015142 [Cajanus cajan]